jgi:protein O-GlcNAc transferase
MEVGLTHTNQSQSRKIRLSQQPPTIEEIERLARQGAYGEAEAACESLLRMSPLEHKAWAWIGMLRLARQRHAEAEAPLRRAIDLFSNDNRYWNALCLSLRSQNRMGEAEVAARNALALLDSAEHWASLANCLYDQQHWQPAIQAYEQALARKPEDSECWRNLGAAEHCLGHLDRALAALDRSLRLSPQDINTQLRYALLQVQLGDIERGIQFAKAVVGRNPEIVPAWLLLGNALRLRDSLAEAETAYREAVKRAPRDHDCRYNLGLVLLQRAQFCEAEAWMRELVVENSNDADAWMVLGGSMHAQARMTEAIDAMRRSVALRRNPTTHSKLVVALHYDSSYSPARILEEHRAWDAIHAKPLLPPNPPGAKSSTGRKLRLGFSAVDFCGGPSGCLALRGLESLDKNACSIVCYSDRIAEDNYSERFRAIADVFQISMSLSDEQLAEQVRRDEIDVFFDMAGHVGRRLLAFARRPAPLQITWLGYTGTTGMAAIDGLLADRFHVRPGEEAWYSEAILRMPHDYACYGPGAGAPSVGALPARTQGCVTFGSFNNPAKYSRQTLDAWSSILRRTPGSRLLLKYGGLNQPNAQKWLHGEFSRRGIAPNRVFLEGWSPNLDTMAQYGRVDLALDTQPYSGGLTTCEALWMGVPVVCCPGSGFATRHATSHVINAGYDQFVVKTMDQYVDKAVEWSNRLDELEVIRSQMRQQVAASSLCDGPQFARDLLTLVGETFESKVRDRAGVMRN